MRERIFSLENEYAVSLFSPGRAEAHDVSELIAALRQHVTERLGAAGSRFTFTVNGSKFHEDVGHAEWSLPECRSAYEAAVYDKAADHVLASLISSVEAAVLGHQSEGRLCLVKNNVDLHGNTYGCHENYLAERQTDWLNADDHRRLTVRFLVPFLVSRQIFCGSGRVGFGRHGEQGFRFQIMQRADFIDEVVSNETTHNRAIVNFGREAEPFAEDRFRRLHLILGDANLSPWATFLKLGTTGILLRMLEDLAIGEIPHLIDPVDALRQISRDPSCSRRVALRGGREATAVEIQRRYLDQAQTYLRTHDCSAEEERIVQEWETALDKLQQQPEQLFGQVDWVTKKCLMDARLMKEELSWDDDLAEHPARYGLLEWDVVYHDLSPQHGLYNQAAAGRLAEFLPPRTVQEAIEKPPPYTRAKVRGDLIRSARRGVAVAVDVWDAATVAGHYVALPDPFAFFVSDIYQLLDHGQPSSS